MSRLPERPVLVRRVLLPALTCAFVVLGATPALAHARLDRIDPAAAQQVAGPPGQVQLVFDEPVGRRFSAVVVTGPDGADWASGDPQVLDATVTQPLRPDGPSGTYTVAYRVVSADGHPVSGSSTFAVLATAASTPPPTVQAPTTQAPTTQAPTTQAPTVQAPTTQTPTVQTPTVRAVQAPAVHPHDGAGGPPVAVLGLLGLLAAAGVGASGWRLSRRRTGGGGRS